MAGPGSSGGAGPRGQARGTDLSYQNLFDLLVLLLLVVAFMIGYLQGAVRRILGIASILFSLVVAAQLRGPVGDFLVENWTSLPPEYSRMIAFGLSFLVVGVAFSIAVQVYYERSRIMPGYPAVDPLLGGVLGVIEGGVIIGAAILILDSYFRGVGIVTNPAELLTLRDLDHAVDVSQTAKIFRHDLIPAFLLLLGAFIPEEIRRLFPA